MLSKKLEDLACWSNKTQSDIYKLFLSFLAESVFILKFLQTKWKNEFVRDADTFYSGGPVRCNTGNILGFEVQFCFSDTVLELQNVQNVLHWSFWVILSNWNTEMVFPIKLN